MNSWAPRGWRSDVVDEAFCALKLFEALGLGCQEVCECLAFSTGELCWYFREWATLMHIATLEMWTALLFQVHFLNFYIAFWIFCKTNLFQVFVGIPFFRRQRWDSELRTLFKKIDAGCSETVTWEEKLILKTETFWYFLMTFLTLLPFWNPLKSFEPFAPENLEHLGHVMFVDFSISCDSWVTEVWNLLHHISRSRSSGCMDRIATSKSPRRDIGQDRLEVHTSTCVKKVVEVKP